MAYRVRHRWRWMRYTLIAIRRLLLHPAIAPRLCNVCGYEGLFYAFGTPPRLDAGCPSCDSLERHRFLKLWMDENVALVQGRTILHFAPAHAERSFIEPLASQYFT